MIDTDTRQLKYDPDFGLYKIGGGKALCGSCGQNQTCSGADLLDTDLKCVDFLPALPFQSDLGLDHIANTMRVGVAWAQRLEVGRVIALYNVKSKRLFGYSRVLYTACGNIHDMLQEHALANHLMLGKPHAGAASELHSYMRQNYGPRIITDATKITAIYLLRLDREAPAPIGSGQEAYWNAEGGAEGSRQDTGD